MEIEENPFEPEEEDKITFRGPYTMEEAKSIYLERERQIEIYKQYVGKWGMI